MGRIVIACGMRRSGSTLQFDLARSILQESGLVWSKQGKGDDRLGFVMGEAAPYIPTWKAADGAVVIKIHPPDNALGDLLDRGEAVGLYTWRDPRDVLVSLTLRDRNKHKGGLDNLIWMTDNLVKINRSFVYWRAKPNVYQAFYAHWIHDIPAEIRRIATFLGVTVDDATVQRIAEKKCMARMMLDNQVPYDHINDGRPRSWSYRLDALQACKVTALVRRMYGANYRPLERAAWAAPLCLTITRLPTAKVTTMTRG